MKFMQNSKFIAEATRLFNRGLLQTKKHSPEILLLTGIGAGVVTLVLACRATKKVDAVLDTTKEAAQQIRDNVEAGKITIVENDEVKTLAYTEDDSKKDLTRVYTKTGLELAKLYGPAVLTGSIALTCILASHGIIHKRNTALMAAYTAVDTGFKDYRKRVVDRFGKELDQELRYNLKTKEIEETVVDENGNKTTVKKTVNVVEDAELSNYACCFTTGCTGWTKDPEANMIFLKLQEKYAQERLEAVGHLFLNEVYDMLGINRSAAGAVVGWIYDPENPNHKGDNRVSFNIHNIHREANRDFVNRLEASVWIDPNVDGVIYDLIS